MVIVHNTIDILPIMSLSAITRTVINTSKAPAAIGPYSQSVLVDRTLYISGQIGLIPESGNFAGDDVKSQTQQVFKNLQGILTAANMNFSNIVKTTILLADMNDYSDVNEIYASYFTPPFPARAAFAVKDLPKYAKVEIEAIAVQGPFKSEQWKIMWNGKKSVFVHCVVLKYETQYNHITTGVPLVILVTANYFGTVVFYS